MLILPLVSLPTDPRSAAYRSHSAAVLGPRDDVHFSFRMPISWPLEQGTPNTPTLFTYTASSSLSLSSRPRNCSSSRHLKLRTAICSACHSSRWMTFFPQAAGAMILSRKRILWLTLTPSNASCMDHPLVACRLILHDDCHCLNGRFASEFLPNCCHCNFVCHAF